MQIRVHRALAAAALFGLAATAGAQERRIPVTKDRTPVDTAPTPVRRDTVYLRDTVTVYRTDTVTVTQQVSTGVVATETPIIDLPGAFYAQIGGGASLPQREMNDFFDTGFNVTGSLGWQPVRSAFGLRLDVGYDKWAGEDVDLGTGNSFRVSDASAWSVLGNATLNLPFGTPASGSGFYLIGGGGWHHFNDFGDFASGGFDVGSGEDTSNDWGINGGAGLRFGFGRAALFVESRYFHVFTEGESTNFLPIIAGFTFR